VICVLCGNASFDALPEPHPQQSILSDLRIVAQPLAKTACRHCGLICRAAQLSPESVYGEEYELYAHAPGRPEELRRQRAYAQWLAPFFSGATCVYEAGAGNGSLLLALSELLPELQGRGVEPADGAASFARAAGFGVETGLLGFGDSARRADIAYAINVIEHSTDPAAFVKMLASHSTGRVAIVCPQGAEPNVEMLFADHHYSFEPAHMRELFHAASLRVEAQVDAPAAIGQFFLTIGRKATTAANVISPAEDFKKRQYLKAWRGLDRALQERLGDVRSAICFGAGEAAGLLRAYAPQAWQRVAFCAMDSPAAETFGDLELRPYSSGMSPAAVLGVRPAAQAAVAQRLERDGYRVIRWDDLIAS